MVRHYGATMETGAAPGTSQYYSIQIADVSVPTVDCATLELWNRVRGFGALFEMKLPPICLQFSRCPVVLGVCACSVLVACVSSA